MNVVSVTIDRISRKEGQGAKGPYTLVGIQVNGKREWINGFADKQGIVDSWKEGDTVELVLSQQEYNGKRQWKFKLPDQGKKQVPSQLETRIAALEKRIEKLETDFIIPEKMPDESKAEEDIVSDTSSLPF